MEHELNITPLRIALLIAENEDLIKVGAARYPVYVHLDNIKPYMVNNIESEYNYIHVRSIFNSDMMLYGSKVINLCNNLYLQLVKQGLLLNCQDWKDVPIRSHNNREMFQ